MPFGAGSGRGVTSGRARGRGCARRTAARGRRAGSRSGAASEAAATLPRTCSTLRAPGMTVVTPGWSITQRRANAAVGTSSPAISATSRAAATPTSNGTPAKVSPTSKASPCRLKFRWSSAGNVVDSSYLPVSRPLASGTRARMPTPAALRGRQQLLQRLAPEDVEDDLERLDAGALDRAQALGDGLHRDAVGGDRLLGDEGVQGVVDPVVLVGGRRRAVQLHEVEGLDAEVAPGPVDPGPQVLRRVLLRGRTGRRGGRPWSRRTAGPTRGASALRMRTSDRPSP